MALDERYRWRIQDGVVDVHGRSKAIGVGIEHGRVIVDTQGWASLAPDAADTLKYSVETASTIAREQQRRS